MNAKTQVVSLYILALLSARAQVTINEFQAQASEKVLKWSASGVPSVGSGKSWMSSSFSDSGWQLGLQPFGQGFTGLGTDVASQMQFKTHSLYLRKSFVATTLQATSTSVLKLGIEYDDGFVAYLNGNEIARKNLGASKQFVYAQHPAYNPVTSNAPIEISIGPANQYLVDGVNVLAIQIHNDDLMGDLKMNSSLSMGVSASFQSLIPLAAAAGNWKYFVGIHEPSGIPVDAKLVTTPFPAPLGKEGTYNDPTEARDWLELKNAQSTPYDLTGHSLSDTVSNFRKWNFPAGTLIPANGYLVIFCDDRFEANGPTTANNLHTNFRLSNDGATLTLSNVTTQIDQLIYPSGQNPHNSFGRGIDGTSLVFMSEATPGAANGGPEVAAIADAPAMMAADGVTSILGDFYNSAQNITLVTTTPGATIRYTTDGSEPTVSSTVYTGPIPVSFINEKTGTVLRARTFASGYLPSRTSTQTYLVGQNSALKTLPAFAMTADAGRTFYKPYGILAIEGGFYDGSGVWQPNGPESFNIPSIQGNPGERETVMEYMHADATTVGFNLRAGVRVSSSPYSRPRLRFQNTGASPWDPLVPEEKASFNLFFRSGYGPGKLDYPIIPNYPVTRFDDLRLRAGKNDIANPHIVDELCRRMHLAMGHKGVAGTWCNLYVNGVFKGYYNVCERVREPMFQEQYNSNLTWDVIFNGVAEDGDRVALDQLLNGDLAADLTVAANWNLVKTKIDINNAIDYYLVKIYSAMWDWPGNNWAMARERSLGPNGIWRMVDWDSEGGFNAIGYTNKNVDFNTIGNELANDNTEVGRIFNRLRTSPEFRLRFADRVQKFMFNGGVLDDRPANSWFKLKKDELKAIVQPMVSYVTGQSFNEGWFNTWTNPTSGRRTHLLGPNNTHFASYGLWPATIAPTFSRPSGAVAFGSSVNLGSSAGTIYYRTDGTDPRLEGGGIAAGSLIYTAPIALSNSVSMIARVRNSNGEWSPRNEANFQVDPVAPTAGNLVIAEMMYNPPSATAAEFTAGITNGDEFEFVRIQNTGTSPVLMAGVSLGNGITYAFSTSGVTALNPGQNVLVVKNLTAFQLRYGSSLPNNTLLATGNFIGNINNAGETIELLSNAVILHTITYTDLLPWPVAADGFGPSLILQAPLSGASLSLPTSWGGSVGAGGRPFAQAFPTSYATWRDLSFNRTTDAAAIKDPTQDPDNDGISNLLEFALGTSPRLADMPSALPVGAILPDGPENYLALTCRINAAASGANIVVEVSSLLQQGTWTSGPGNTVSLVPMAESLDGARTFTIRNAAPVDAATPRKFIRLSISLQ